MNRKHFLIATLSALALLTLAFAPISTQQIGSYDPWADYDGDGKIDILDIASTAIAYGSSGDPTRNVTVTNWPEDRPPVISEGIERIVVLDASTGDWGGYGIGITLAKPVFGDGNFARFAYDFEPKGQLINVTDIYVNYIWRADIAGSLSDPHEVRLTFWQEVPLGEDFTGFSLSQSVGWPWSTRTKAYSLRASEEPAWYWDGSTTHDYFNFTLIQPGINSVDVSRSDQVGDYIYIFSLVLYIEYYYWA